jgi:hypothetical protein
MIDPLSAGNVSLIKKYTNQKASIEGLRQMYAYNHFWNSHKSMLLYPARASQCLD